jgi:hypothetical protein
MTIWQLTIEPYSNFLPLRKPNAMAGHVHWPIASLVRPWRISAAVVDADIPAGKPPVGDRFFRSLRSNAPSTKSE